MPAASKEWLQNTFTESEHAASVTRPSRPLAHVTLESSDAEQEREEKHDWSMERSDALTVLYDIHVVLIIRAYVQPI